MRQHAKNSLPNNQRQIPGSTQIPNSSNNNLTVVEISNSNRVLPKSTKISDQREAKQKRNEWRKRCFCANGTLM